MPRIKVAGKIDAGFSPVIGQVINKGQEYEIDEGEFSDELYTRPEGWTPPWERETKKTKGGDK